MACVADSVNESVAAGAASGVVNKSVDEKELQRVNLLPTGERETRKESEESEEESRCSDVQLSPCKP